MRSRGRLTSGRAGTAPASQDEWQALLMPRWICFGRDVSDAPAPVNAFVDEVLEALPRVTATEGLDGGFKRSYLRIALAGPIEAHGLRELVDATTFAGKEIDYFAPHLGVALTLQGGRARNNNGVQRAVLAAAAIPDVQWLVAAAPTRYKSSLAAEPIREDLTRLAHSAGIKLKSLGRDSPRLLSPTPTPIGLSGELPQQPSYRAPKLLSSSVRALFAT